MLVVAGEVLPNNVLSYLAFRVAFLETLERLALARQVGDEDEEFGFLTEVPFLSAVPPQVQLDLLAETWRKHSVPRRVSATLLDEAVVYAVCETAAHIAEDDPRLVERCMACGPRAGRFVADEYLSTALRNLHLSLPSEGDFLLISQFEDMPPSEARRLKQELRLDEERLQPLFDALGRWNISAGFLRNLRGLFSDREIARTAAILGLQPIQS